MKDSAGGGDLGATEAKRSRLEHGAGGLGRRSAHTAVGHVGGRIYALTNKGAPSPSLSASPATAASDKAPHEHNVLLVVRVRPLSITGNVYVFFR